MKDVRINLDSGMFKLGPWKWNYSPNSLNESQLTSLKKKVQKKVEEKLIEWRGKWGVNTTFSEISPRIRLCFHGDSKKDVVSLTIHREKDDCAVTFSFM